MLIYGAGGHAKVIISCVTASGDSIQAVFDDDVSKKEISKIVISGSYDPILFSDKPIIIAIGDHNIRRKIAQKISHHFGNVIHPTAIIDKSVFIDKGTVVMHGSILQADTVIGKHVIINTHVTIDHDCHIADFVHLAPGVILCGDVHVGENTFIGAGSIVVPNITIGNNCFTAAGSVITQSIPNNSIVRGNPARIIKTSI